MQIKTRDVSLYLTSSFVLGIIKLHDVSEAGSALLIRCKRGNNPTQSSPQDRASFDH
jgi:hypothetical protein